MVTAQIIGDTLHLHIEGMDRIWALKSRLSIPLRHITSVRTDAEVTKQWWHGIKWPGTSLPGVIAAGGSTVRTRKGLASRTRLSGWPTMRGSSALMYAEISGSSGMRNSMPPPTSFSQRQFQN